MAKYGCRHCGGENEVPLSAEAKIEEVGKNLAALIQAKANPTAPAVDLTPVMERLEQIAQVAQQPPVVHTSCSEHPEFCQHKPQLEQALAELAEVRASHHVLTPEYIAAQVDSCPNCKKGVEEYVEKEVKKRGMVKPETPAPTSAPVSTPATEASVAAPVDDDTPPWRRG